MGTRIIIYLIDDESTFRSQFKRAMKRAGFRPDEFRFQEFATTDEAVRAFEQSSDQPRLALFDQNVKSSTYKGTEAIRKLHEQGDIEAILGIISSSNKAQEVDQARSFGARFWIRKGGGRAAMIEKMRRFKAEIFDPMNRGEKVPEWLEIGLQ